MRHQINNKNIFQLALFTLFSSLLLVGMMGVTNAQAETLNGTAKGTENCNVGAGGLDKGKTGKVDVILVVNRTPGEPVI
jgi:hypothetical protein